VGHCDFNVCTTTWTEPAESTCIAVAASRTSKELRNRHGLGRSGPIGKLRTFATNFHFSEFPCLSSHAIRHDRILALAASGNGGSHRNRFSPAAAAAGARGFESRFLLDRLPADRISRAHALSAGALDSLGSLQKGNTSFGVLLQDKDVVPNTCGCCDHFVSCGAMPASAG
jgi:hypothetical protein